MPILSAPLDQDRAVGTNARVIIISTKMTTWSLRRARQIPIGGVEIKERSIEDLVAAGSNGRTG